MDRTAFVEVNSSVSSHFSIPAGVPQGSLLAPLLYNIFVHDIPTPKGCDLALYADDSAMLYEASK